MGNKLKRQFSVLGSSSSSSSLSSWHSPTQLLLNSCTELKLSVITLLPMSAKPETVLKQKPQLPVTTPQFTSQDQENASDSTTKVPSTQKPTPQDAPATASNRPSPQCSENVKLKCFVS